MEPGDYVGFRTINDRKEIIVEGVGLVKMVSLGVVETISVLTTSGEIVMIGPDDEIEVLYHSRYFLAGLGH